MTIIQIIKKTKMRTFLLSSALACTVVSSSIAQSNQVQNAFNYLKNKEYDKAKIAADLAAVNASTSNGAKTWYYRGKIYKAICEDKDVAVKNIDPAAEEKALESFITCLKLDKGNDIYKNEVKGLLVQSSYAVYQKSKFLQAIKNTIKHWFFLIW